jgi:hypothetical protein
LITVRATGKVGHLMSTATTSERATQSGTRVAVGISVLSLLLSGWSMVMTLDDEADRGEIEKRLACLELPGPNDCGPDR